MPKPGSQRGVERQLRQVQSDPQHRKAW
jgi:hypothetical protein